MIDLVEVTPELEPPQVGTTFLGYDILEGIQSLLPAWLVPFSYDLKVPPGWEQRPWEEDGLVDLRPHYGPQPGERYDRLSSYKEPVHQLVAEHFAQYLNKYWLFDDYSAAKFCFDVMTCIRYINPVARLFDQDVGGEAAAVRIVGIYLVADDEERREGS